MSGLHGWLDFIARQHPVSIALGLERVREVAARMALPAPAPIVITVGGTNGKGSTIAFIEAMLRAAGYRVGCYTSPHLLRYNERVRVDATDAGDADLVAAFERVEKARGGTPLTYFEFGTLAALDHFAAQRLDVAVLEVGLGGRLDAVNIIDADVAVVTTIDLDHQDFLGRDRDSIAIEKAGIFRAGRVAVIGDADPPPALLDQARRCGAQIVRRGVEFDLQRDSAGAIWTDRGNARIVLPAPQLQAPAQFDNAATAIAALRALRSRLVVDDVALIAGVLQAQLPGRLQQVALSPQVWLDVGHNPQAARTLAAWLAGLPRGGRNLAVFSALADKDVEGIVAALREQVWHWHIAGLQEETPRGLTAEALRAKCAPALAGARISLHHDVAAAIAQARAIAAPDDRILIFGSFYTVAAARRALPV